MMGLSAFLLLMTASPDPFAAAEIGVSRDEIVIGSCLDIDSPQGNRGKKRLAGARAYFDYVNAAGGVHGRKLKLVAGDDSYDADKAIECFQKLMKDGVFAGAFFLGSVPGAKYVDLAQKHKFPVVGFNAGAEFLFEPTRRYVFNTRASFKEALKGQVDLLWNEQGLRKFAVIYQEDALGANILAGVRQALSGHGASPAALGSFSPSRKDEERAVAVVRERKPQVVILGCLGVSAAKVVQQAKASGWKPLFVFPTNDLNFLKMAGADADGTIMLQFLPSPDRTDLPAVELFKKLQQDPAPASPDFLGLEGFIDAKVLVEGLKRAGPDLTREKLVDSLESLRDEDIGLGTDFKIRYGPSDHGAFSRVSYTVVQGGRIVDVMDWKSLTR